MRICMLVKNTFTHDARVEKEAATLIGAGHAVTVIALSNGGQAAHEVRDGIVILRVPRGPGNRLRTRNDTSAPQSRDVTSAKRPLLSIALRRIGASPIGDFVHWLTDRRMAAVAATLDFDVVHAHDLDCLAVGVRVAHRSTVPLIYDSHEMATGRNMATPRRRRLALRREKRLLPHVSRLITAAPGYRDRIEQIHGPIPGAVVLNASPAVDLAGCTQDLRAALGWQASDFVAVHQGVLLPNRGIDQAIAAVAMAPGVRLAIIGYGPHRAALEAQVRALGVEDRVRFLGAVPARELVCWSASADVGLCTIVGDSDSYRHSMPNKLFEYIMAQVPIIASDYEGMGSLVAANGFGLTCDPTSPPQISAALMTMRDDSELRQTCRDNLAAHRLDFSWDVQAAALLRVYESL